MMSGHSLAPLPGTHGAADWEVGDPPPRGAGGASAAGLDAAPCGLRWAELTFVAAEDRAVSEVIARVSRQAWAKLRLHEARVARA